jgi:hypothetical protein
MSSRHAHNGSQSVHMEPLETPVRVYIYCIMASINQSINQSIIHAHTQNHPLLQGEKMNRHFFSKKKLVAYTHIFIFILNKNTRERDRRKRERESKTDLRRG